MPKVGKRSFPYTPQGVRAATRAKVEAARPGVVAATKEAGKAAGAAAKTSAQASKAAVKAAPPKTLQQARTAVKEGVQAAGVAGVAAARTSVKASAAAAKTKRTPVAKADQPAVSAKISHLVEEGKPQDQSVATALNMAREKRLGPKGGYRKKK